MIDFTEKTYAALRKQMLESVPDIYDKRDTAPVPTAISPAAYVFEGFYLSLDLVQRQAFVQTAVGSPGIQHHRQAGWAYSIPRCLWARASPPSTGRRASTLW